MGRSLAVGGEAGGGHDVEPIFRSLTSGDGSGSIGEYVRVSDIGGVRRGVLPSTLSLHHSAGAFQDVILAVRVGDVGEVVESGGDGVF
jgi:hypothetical protein